LLAEARDTKDQIISEAKGKAKQEAEKIMAQSREAIETEKKAALAEIKNLVATLSLEIAEKIIKQELSDDKKQQELVSKLMDEVKLN
jgi:F-type H+-transporting ATPase subunit b